MTDQLVRKEAGIRRKRQGFQAYVFVNGRMLTKMYRADARLADVRQWRLDQLALQPTPEHGSFAADIRAYLARVGAMPTYAQRAAHLALWAQALGEDRPTRTITTPDIEQVIQTWLTTPTRPIPDAQGRRGRASGPDGVAPATVRKRLTALKSFFVKLQGKYGANPARGAAVPQEPKATDRSIDRIAIEQAIAAMPVYQSGRPGEPPQLSLSRVCIEVIAATGIPPGLLCQVRATDLDLDRKTRTGLVRLRARKKGGGVEARSLPLMPDAVDAFLAFDAANAYGRVPTTLNRCFKAALQRVGLDARRHRLYDLRHSFLTDLYRETGDLATVQRMALHAPGSPITARYAMGAHADVDRAAVTALAAAWTARRRRTLKAVSQSAGPRRTMPAHHARKR